MQNIFNQGSMQEFATYVAIIRTIATQIRELQYQNGMSEHEVDLYLIAAISKHFDEKAHTKDTFKSFLVSIIGRSHTLTVTLLKIIALLQTQLLSLNCLLSPLVLPKCDPVEPISNNRKYSFHITGITSQDASRNDTTICLSSKSRQFYSNSIQIEQYENDLDLIHESVRQTLQRTKKLKAYLNYRSKQEDERRKKYQSRVQNFGAIYE